MLSQQQIDRVRNYQNIRLAIAFGAITFEAASLLISAYLTQDNADYDLFREYENSTSFLANLISHNSNFVLMFGGLNLTAAMVCLVPTCFVLEAYRLRALTTAEREIV